MKAEDLMVNDIVLLAGDPYRVQKEDFTSNIVNSFEQAPLTDSILEKLGWKREERGCKEDEWYSKRGIPFGIRVFNEEFDDEPMYIDTLYYDAVFCFKYVSQLQHLLTSINKPLEVWNYTLNDLIRVFKI